MAKKPKKADDEAADGQAGGDAKPGGKKKKLIMLLAVVLLLGGGGGGYWFYAKKKAAALAEGGHGEQAPAKPKQTAFVEVKEMIVNLAGQNVQQTGERPRYLKVKVALEVDNPSIVAEVTPLLPRIEDSFQVYLRELRVSDLDGSAGVYRLKEELLRRVNVALYPSKVDAILFKEILIQ
jgi:flagellar protein FliL